MTRGTICAKEQLRREMIRLRNRLAEADRVHCSRTISEILLQSDQWKNSRVVMSYMSFGSEVDTSLFNAASMQEGKILVLPKVEVMANALSTYRISDLESDLETGQWGIREPRPEACRPIEPGRIDFILVPGVAFDLGGGRIGYGKGFYDRFIGNCRKEGRAPLTVGASFGMQLLANIPLSPNDRPVDVIVTEKGWHCCQPDRND